MKSPLGLWETGRKGGFAVKTHRLSLPSEAIFKKRKKKKRRVDFVPPVAMNVARAAAVVVHHTRFLYILYSSAIF